MHHRRMERAIANHGIQKARLHADEERKERENLRLLPSSLIWKNTAAGPALYRDHPRRPFSDVQKRCDDDIAEGVAQLWLLHLGLKQPDSHQNRWAPKFQGESLQIAKPPLEMELSAVFSQDHAGLGRTTRD